MKEDLKKIGVKTDYKPGDIIEIMSEDPDTIRRACFVGQRFYVSRVSEYGVWLAIQTGIGELSDFYYEFTRIMLFKEKP